MRNINLIIKRLMDFIGSSVGTIIILPILIIIAIVIKLTSKGPVFFKQERLGKDGEIFKIFKFRTMIVNAEKIGDGLSVNSANDIRITKIGKILRATSLDELPQLFNVVLGQMSLVGPRPPVIYFPYDGYKNYPEWAKKRFAFQPGITGLTQVTVRNSVNWDERIKIDNQYVDTFNIWLDIRLLIRTFKRIFKSENLYMEKPK